MLFNSLEFIVAFLPTTLLVFFLIGHWSNRLAALWLASASLFFYGWWDTRYVPLLVASILFNYGVGFAIAGAGRKQDSGVLCKIFLIIGIVGDLSLLCYYKYSFFVVTNFNHLFGAQFEIGQIILPLGISFFTFTQIAFLVDTYQNKIDHYDIVHYFLFVTYFPHLIAGPIYHHSEIMPQFKDSRTYRIDAQNIAMGLAMFAAGLFKKIVFADQVAVFARPVFSAAASGTPVGFIEAWGGALAYSLQLYFDFSGYVDMAIGLSMMVGVKLPLNFHSPYKATNITEFWRRWHMTLSRLMRDYLYIPLGGNRHGLFRSFTNLMVTMLVGGLWHGAAWTFVVWGGVHGAYLVINHGWRSIRKYAGMDLTQTRPVGRVLSRCLTFCCVVAAFVIFRADDLNAAKIILNGMAGLNGISLPDVWVNYIGKLGELLSAAGVSFKSDFNGLWQGAPEAIWISVLLAIVWLAPNTQQIMARFEPALNVPDDRVSPIWSFLQWRPNYQWGLICGLVALGGLVMMIASEKVSEFLYFQF